MRVRVREREIYREWFCLRLFVSERRAKAGDREERGKGETGKEAEMVGANLKAETMVMMESRTAVEAEMDAIIARLSRPGGAGLQGNLVDSEVHSSQLFFFFFFFFYSFASSSTPLPTLLLPFSLRIGLREREREDVEIVFPPTSISFRVGQNSRGLSLLVPSHKVPFLQASRCCSCSRRKIKQLEQVKFDRVFADEIFK